MSGTAPRRTSPIRPLPPEGSIGRSPVNEGPSVVRHGVDTTKNEHDIRAEIKRLEQRENDMTLPEWVRREATLAIETLTWVLDEWLDKLLEK